MNDSEEVLPFSSCTYEKHQWLETKFYLLSVCGTLVAVFGIVTNIINAVILQRPKVRSPSNIYLKILALADALVLITGVMLYSMEYIFEYFESVLLYTLWIHYVRLVYPLSHISQTGSVYVTVSVTIERYLEMVRPNLVHGPCRINAARITLFAMLIFSIAFNFSTFFEIEVVFHGNCTGFSSMELKPTQLLMNELYTYIYSFWLSQLVMVVIPFVVLFVFNACIALQLRHFAKQQERRLRRDFRLVKSRAKSREATVVLVVIVTSFLVCNFWSLVMALLEVIYGSQVLHETFPAFYQFSREVINFLALVNSSINFIIYYVFGKEFRHECRLLLSCGKKRALNRKYYFMNLRERPFNAERYIMSTSTLLDNSNEIAISNSVLV